MKLLKVLGIGLLILAGLGALAWVNRFTVLSLIAQSRLPDVAPNREVVWEPGPAEPSCRCTIGLPCRRRTSPKNWSPN